MPTRIFPKLSEGQLDLMNSSAEAMFYRACRDQLPADFLVLHSLSLIFENLKNHSHHVGETDFVIFNPKGGILVVEVKGGGIKYQPETGADWKSIDRFGNEHVIKNPFEQSKNYQFRILDLVRDKVGGLKKSDFLFGHSVAFPDIRQRELGTIIAHNRPREIIACADDLENLFEWYERITKFWQGKEELEPIGFQSFREIERVFLKPIYAKPSISIKLQEEELQRIKLTDEQARLLLFLENHNRGNICGGAGTGKTVLAKKMAEKFGMDGKKTALICYNKALGENIKTDFESHNSIQAGTYHSFFSKLLGNSFTKYMEEAKEAYPSSDEWKVTMPFAFLMALEEREELKFDAVIIDEGQDFSPEMWLSITELTKDETSKIFIFSDTHQGLYSKKNNIPSLSPPFMLSVNCRNTKQIHDLAYKEYDGPHIAPPNIEGEPVVSILNSSFIQQTESIIDILNKLTQIGDVSASEITILVADSKNFEGHIDQLKKAKTKYQFTRDELSTGPKIKVSTVKRFKGLESQVLIVWGLEELPKHQQRELKYVGLTRAKSLLYAIN